jgi:hypothetical protein
MIPGATTGFSELARRLIESADPRVHARSSFDNFHRRGMLYLNLLRSPDLTCKLYVLKPGWGELLPGGILVDPHSHAYAFHSTTLAGEMTNVLFEEDDAAGEDWYRFTYESIINGGRGFDSNGKRGLSVTRREHVPRGATYYLRPDQVHSIAVPTDRATVLFLCQYRDERTVTDFYSTNVDPPSTDGLYQPVSEARYTA